MYALPGLLSTMTRVLAKDRLYGPNDFHASWWGDGVPSTLAAAPLFGLSANAFVLLEVLAVAASLGLWFLLLGAVITWTRPADVRALPASADFPDDLPPAVVNLLANRWRLNEDAAESTLLDLAARHWLELRQPGNDPMQTTVHLLAAPGGQSAESALTAYEQQVLEHVRHQAVQDVVPVTALTFRDADQAGSWETRLHASVVEDARARGLTRRRFSGSLVTFLSFVAAGPGALLAAVIAYDSHELAAAGIAGLLLWFGLGSAAGWPRGERDTPLGREVAARWFAVRSFLRGDEAFAELPPAAVTVWDRYLSYGDALGVNRVCTAVLDLGMGNRKLVWSSFGDRWHQVRVRYPRGLPRYGATPWSVLLRGGVCVLLGGLIVHFLTGAGSVIASHDTSGSGSGSGSGSAAEGVPLAIGWLLLGYGGYLLLRMLIDLLAPRTLTGEVLWVELWKSTQAKEDSPAVPMIHYLAVDDGTADRTTAWALPSQWCHRADPGDVVTVLVRPWTRRITELTVVSDRSARFASVDAGGPASDSGGGSGMGGAVESSGDSGSYSPAGQGVSGLDSVAGHSAGAAQGAVASLGVIPGLNVIPGFGSPARPAVVGNAVPATVPLRTGASGAPSTARDRSQPLLSADEVSAALGRPVTIGGSGGLAVGPFEMATYSVPGDRTPVLMLAVARGLAVKVLLRTARGGQPLPGIGDEAWLGRDWVIGRRADTMVRINLPAGSPAAAQALPALLTTALTRI